ncbi:MAG: flagellar biosynthesis protein FlhB [Deltaproteobacteria bacterium]
MAENDQEKTEQPTSRRLDEARQEGKYAVSKELSSFLVMLGALIVFYFAGLWMTTGVAEFMRSSFAPFRAELTAESAFELFKHVSLKFLVIVAPILAIPLFGAISYLAQTGFGFSGKPFEPDMERINPIPGFQRLFSLKSVVEVFKSIVKVSILSYVVYVNVKKEWLNMPFLVDMEVAASLYYIARVSFSIMVKTVWVLAVIAVLDYVYQRWEFQRGLKMSRDEIKEEAREMEGDPIVKSRIRTIQRDLARKRMMQNVPKADFVVTNPTHLAVAIAYDRKEANAPKVIAKGAGHLAEKIKEIARKHNVPVLENKPLAQGLYKLVEVGMEIPVSLYKAVAEVLAYVYRLKRKSVA